VQIVKSLLLTLMRLTLLFLRVKSVSCVVSVSIVVIKLLKFLSGIVNGSLRVVRVCQVFGEGIIIFIRVVSTI